MVSDSGQFPHGNPKGFAHQMDLANEISAVRENLMSIIINKMTITVYTLVPFLKFNIGLDIYSFHPK